MLRPQRQPERSEPYILLGLEKHEPTRKRAGTTETPKEEVYVVVVVVVVVLDNELPHKKEDS